MSLVDFVRDTARAPRVWARQVVHNTWGIVNVLDITRWRPLPGGLLPEDHPLCTGIDPASGRPIWPANLVYATPAAAWAPEPDDAIVTRVGRFLAGMVTRSAPRGAAWPDGRPSRMPAAINYLHAGIHYNGVWLVFNDFAEAFRHFSDARFRADFVRLVTVERREPVSIFRRKDYDRAEFGELVCFLRSVLPFFSNSNGPRERVLWGNPAPYAAVNTITGHWMKTVRLVADPARRHLAARPPLADRAAWFAGGPYAGWRDHALPHERWLARQTARRLALRGEREGLFFVDRRLLRRGFRFIGERLREPAEVRARRRAALAPAPATVTLWARRPEPGRVKTRLVPTVSPETAAELATAFLADSFQSIAARPWARPVVAADGELPAAVAPAGARVWAQGDGDLGARLERILARGLGETPAGGAFAVGADSPGLPAALLDAAQAVLAAGGPDTAVLGPADDGGFYLIGLRRVTPGLFAGVAWSRADTRAAVAERLVARGYRVTTLAPWFDVDRPEDLARLASLLARGEVHAPATARVLGLAAAAAP